jgi:tetratricopeptide (TPR) repeat protein
MRSSEKLILALLLSILTSGCTATWQQLQSLVTSPAEHYRQLALAYEKEDELQQAIFYWGVVAHLDQKNPDVPKIIKSLKHAAAKAAQVHFQRGREHYRTGDLNNAMREFLIAIRLNPRHEHARDYLKTALQNPEQGTYRVKSGDSFIKIASDTYKDPTKAFLIAYFNDMDPRKPLLIGTNLYLPALEAEYLIPRSDIKSLLDKAQIAYEKKRYTRVYELAEAIQKEIPNHSGARQLADTARFDQGMLLMHRKHFLAAIEQFKQISSKFPGRDQAIARARKQISKQAIDEKLEAAREHLRSRAWASVINVTEEILEQDPGNDQAKMLFSNASYKLGKILLDRGETAKSIEILSRIEPSYEDTGQLLSLARARTKSQAETLYRDGVKQFINEDLEKAVTTWKKVLELNPDHPKARQDMENAERLLEKLKALDKEPEKAGQ